MITSLQSLLGAALYGDCNLLIPCRKVSIVCRADEAEEPQSPCPYCNVPGPETELNCIQCQSIIPFRIASGVL